MSVEEKDLDRYRDRAIEDRNRNVQNANYAENSLCGQLMLVCTVFLTVSTVVIANEQILTALSNTGKTLLLAGLTLVLLSIAAGIKYYFELIGFHQKWSEAHHKDHELLQDQEACKKDWNSAVDKLNSHQTGLDSLSNERWLRWQVGLLAGGGIVYFILVAGVLFDFNLTFNI